MTPLLDQAREALDFAQAHEWGRGASLLMTDNGPRIAGLLDVVSRDNVITMRTIDLPARVSLLRDWAGY